MLIAVGIGWGMGFLQARETEHRYHTPRAYQESAEAHARRACVGLESVAAFECIDKHVEAAYEQANAEQDLSAQQRAATSAMLSAVVSFLALIATGFGLYYVRETLLATLRAVKDTGDATDEMRRANAISNRIVEAELRPYLFVEKLALSDVLDFNTVRQETGKAEEKRYGSFVATVDVHLRNAGKVPARNIKVYIKRYLGQLDRGRFWNFKFRCTKIAFCGPAYQRRVFMPCMLALMREKILTVEAHSALSEFASRLPVMMNNRFSPNGRLTGLEGTLEILSTCWTKQPR